MQLKVNNKLITFEVDTGSYLSTLSANELNSMNSVNICKTSTKAKGYGDSLIEFLGEAELNIMYNKSVTKHKFLIVDSDRVSLLGRDLCNKLNLQFAVPCDINNIQQDVLSKHEYFLSDNFKSCVSEAVTLEINSKSKPIFCKARSVPLRFRELVKTELSRLEENGIITKVFNAKWASPCVNVLKSNNTVRICGDYSTTINKSMDLVQYPLASIEHVLGEIGNAKVFSKIDCQNAYLQIPLDKKSKELTTLNTIHGLYSYNFLPFGLCNSPGIFQSFMCRTLSGINNIIIYQDDVLVMTENTIEHCKSLDQVFSALKQAGVKVNKNKCSFFTNSVQYLGYIFDNDGVHPNPDKIKAIIDAPTPTNLSQVQSFMGLCNFYSRFIKDFSTVFAPLYQLLKKNTKFHWNAAHEKCFQTIKNLFKCNTVLKLFDPKLETAIETDASSVGIGCVLMQKYNNQWFPVQFSSRTLNNAERNYSQIEREALSIIFACEKFKQFLLGSQFTIKNDHKPLEKLFGPNKNVPINCSARLQRWALRLSQFKYKFEFIKGVDNVNSDFLSRLPLSDTVLENEPYELIFVLDSLEKTAITCKDIALHTDKDQNLCLLKQYIKYGFPAHIDNYILKPYKNLVGELSILKNCIMYNNRVLIPESLRSKVLYQLHTGHPGICVMKSIARSIVWYPGIDKDIQDVVKSCKQCAMVSSKPPKKSFIEWPLPEKPWSRLHIDHLFFENHILLIVVDSLSKYIEVEIVKNVSALETIECLRNIFSRHGLPETIVSDNATSFTASEFKEFLFNNSINHITSAPYMPSSNGRAERGVRIIKELLMKSVNGSFRTRLSNALLYYRSKPHCITKIAPCIALNNRKYITVNDKLNPRYISNCNLNINKKINKFEIGDQILALNLRDGPKWYYGTVVDILGQNVYNVHVHDLDVTWKRHLHQLLPTVNTPNYNCDNSLPVDNNKCNINGPHNNVLPRTTNSNIPLSCASVPISDNYVSVDNNVAAMDSSLATDNNVAEMGSSRATANNNSRDVTLRRSTRISKPVKRYIEGK